MSLPGHMLAGACICGKEKKTPVVTTAVIVNVTTSASNWRITAATTASCSLSARQRVLCSVVLAGQPLHAPFMVQILCQLGYSNGHCCAAVRD